VRGLIDLGSQRKPGILIKSCLQRQTQFEQETGFSGRNPLYASLGSTLAIHWHKWVHCAHWIWLAIRFPELI